MPKMLWRPGLRPGPHWKNSRPTDILLRGGRKGGQGAMPPKPCQSRISALGPVLSRLPSSYYRGQLRPVVL